MTRDVSFPDDLPFTVEGMRDEYLGSTHESALDSERHWECDWCATGVLYKGGSSGAMYFADDLVGDQPQPDASFVHEHRPMTALALYCEDCATDRLLFPCEGYAEVRAQVEFDPDRTYTRFDVTDISGRDDGIPWDPKEVHGAITDLPFETMAAVNGPQGPENMVTVMLSYGDGIDLRELVDYEGNLDPKYLGKARRIFEDHVEEMAGAIRGEPDARKAHRKKFRDNIQEGRDDA